MRIFFSLLIISPQPAGCEACPKHTGGAVKKQVGRAANPLFKKQQVVYDFFV